uniref:kinesin-like protein KIF6 n=1 Tax=Ciona intestinalis TaxID=7719 RepID=UPI00089DBA8F|nr:kinesin-like protein KIF6 [Ciona intestinalis]|eukprot:XP_018671967.1 kinesin-like protein KIF6 [Ciona intestinalis]
MSSENINVFCRVRPAIDDETIEYKARNTNTSNFAELEVENPLQSMTRQSNNAATSHKFAFTRIFDQDATQSEIYEATGRPLVESAFQGFNATLFVYGQTATGKTYTVSGNDVERSNRRSVVEKRKKRRRSKSDIRKTQNGGIPNVKQQQQNQQEQNQQEQNNQEEKQQEQGDFSDTQNPTIENSTQENEVKMSPTSSPYLEVKEDSGIISRILSDVFNSSTNDIELVSVTVSYLEIYKEVGYDLLAEGRSKSHPDELPRVAPMKDARNRLNLRNLSVQTVNSEEEALRWFELGNTNRKVAETHLNDASSRSHCVFSIGVKCRHGDNKTTLNAKVNLVDLAGSERVGKSHLLKQNLLTEARNINLSLHHLQQVIIALSKGTIRHIPYRNSLLTQVLSDSLGGNSRTLMVATISAQKRHLEESVSTCQFAQRVAEITNKVKANISIDSDAMIARLEDEIKLLKEEIGSKTSTDAPAVHLEENELDQLIQDFLNGRTDTLDVGLDLDGIQYCFRRLRELILNKQTEIPHPGARDPEQKKKKSKSCVIL